MTEGPAASHTARRTVISRLQRGIESLYRVDTKLDVESFLISEDHRRHSGVTRMPREQLLVRQGHEDEVQIGLFLDSAVVSNLEQNDPARGLDQGNFSDFCVAVEGVSHFVYVALCAAGDRSVSALELELQAEVDKFACCLLIAGEAEGDETPGAAPSAEGARRLTSQLYEEVSFAADLDAEERDRYRVANGEARRYAETLSRTFVARDRVSELLPELRRFYRLGLEGKLGHIARIAA